MRPFLMLVVAPIDLQNKSYRDARRIYKQQYRQAVKVTEHIDPVANWKILMNFYLPKDMGLRDVAFKLPPLKESEFSFWLLDKVGLGKSRN